MGNIGRVSTAFGGGYPQRTARERAAPMSKPNRAKKLSVFLAESMAAGDMYRGLLEGEAIAQILKLLGVKVTYRIVTDAKRLRKAIREADTKGFSVFHLSCHASRDAFDLTSDDGISWAELARIAKDRLEDIVLCLSACEAGHIRVANEFRRQGGQPSYIVGPESNVGYAQACVAWSVFYNSLTRTGISRDNMKDALDRMNQAVDTDFVYRRRTGQRYFRYPKRRGAREASFTNCC